MKLILIALALSFANTSFADSCENALLYGSLKKSEALRYEVEGNRLITAADKMIIEGKWSNYAICSMFNDGLISLANAVRVNDLGCTSYYEAFGICEDEGVANHAEDEAIALCYKSEAQIKSHNDTLARLPSFCK